MDVGCPAACYIHCCVRLSGCMPAYVLYGLALSSPSWVVVNIRAACAGAFKVVDAGAVPAGMGAQGAEGPSTPPAVALRGPDVVERVSQPICMHEFLVC